MAARSPLPTLLAAALVAGCPAPPPAADRAPLIQAFDQSPKQGIKKGDFVTFTLVAVDPEGKPLQYNWTATKGTLTANSGSTVAWSPSKPDGSFQEGLSTVTVVASDGLMTTTATVNIQIDARGEATILGGGVPPGGGQVGLPAPPNPYVPPTATPQPTPTSTPQPAPTFTPWSEPTAAPWTAPTATPQQAPERQPAVLLSEGFEGGLVNFDHEGRDDLAWSVRTEGAQAGARCAAFSDAGGQIGASIYDRNGSLYLKLPVRLDDAKAPRLRFYLKGGAVPQAAATITVNWVDEYCGQRACLDRVYHPLATVSAGMSWREQTVDLLSYVGKAGYLEFRALVRNSNGATFPGLLIDSVTVEDEG